MNNRAPEAPLSIADQKRVDHLALEQRAIACDAEILEIWARMRKDWWRLGELFYKVTTDGLWKLLNDGDGNKFETIDSWLIDRIPEVGRSAAYAARKAFTDLSPHISTEDLSKIPMANTRVLAALPERMRGDADLVKAAQTKTETELVDHVNAKVPNLHLEQKTTMKLKPGTSQRAEIDRAIEVMMWAEELKNREESLESLACYFLDSKCEVEGFRNLSNRQAFDKAHGKKVKAKGAGK